MPTQPGLDGHMRMVELADELHIKALHDGARFEIANRSECNDLSKAEMLKSKSDDGACSLSSVTLSPIGFARRQPISTQGKNGSSLEGVCNPTKPMNWLDARSSIAQNLQPRSSMNIKGSIVRG